MSSLMYVYMWVSTDSKLIVEARIAADTQHHLELCRTSSVSRMGVITSNLTKSSDLSQLWRALVPSWTLTTNPRDRKSCIFMQICKDSA